VVAGETLLPSKLTIQVRFLIDVGATTLKTRRLRRQDGVHETKKQVYTLEFKDFSMAPHQL
jgi:hypothetical protein